MDWQCGLCREEILKIWDRPSDSDLQTEEDKKVFNLLIKYNGLYAHYHEYERSKALRWVESIFSP